MYQSLSGQISCTWSSIKLEKYPDSIINTKHASRQLNCLRCYEQSCEHWHKILCVLTLIVGGLISLKFSLLSSCYQSFQLSLILVIGVCICEWRWMRYLAAGGFCRCRRLIGCLLEIIFSLLSSCFGLSCFSLWAGFGRFWFISPPTNM